MRRVLFAAALLVSLLAPMAIARPPIVPALELGTHTGSVSQGSSTGFSFSSGGDPCLGVYLPHTFVVNVVYPTTSDVLTISSHDRSAVTSDGHGTLSFVDNYCTTFGVTVTGTSVAGTATFVINIRDAGPVLN